MTLESFLIMHANCTTSLPFEFIDEKSSSIPAPQFNLRMAEFLICTAEEIWATFRAPRHLNLEL